MLKPEEYTVSELIPQRHPFQLIDSLIDFEAWKGTSSFVVSAEHLLCNGIHLTEAGLIENIAQTAAAHAGYSSKLNNEPVMVGFIGGIKNLIIHELPKVGDVILTTIMIENRVMNALIITGQVMRNNACLASCEMKIFINA
jgi:predicted hotdog family 3-hydroxylacyl-ACP dehydratase